MGRITIQELRITNGEGKLKIAEGTETYKIMKFLRRVLHSDSRRWVSIVLLGCVVLFAVFGYFILRAYHVRTAIKGKSVAEVVGAFDGATLETSVGNIVIQFLPKKAPNTVYNFIKLADAKFYDGTKFHRVIKDFMIQGGDPLSRTADTSRYGTGGPGYTFADEINNEPMTRGAVAMANSGPNTNGSQFFIITAPDTPWLQGKHTVFARVISGMDVADKINAIDTNSRAAPLDPVVVTHIYLR